MDWSNHKPQFLGKERHYLYFFQIVLLLLLFQFWKNFIWLEFFLKTYKTDFVTVSELFDEVPDFLMKNNSIPFCFHPFNAWLFRWSPAFEKNERIFSFQYGDLTKCPVDVKTFFFHFYFEAKFERNYLPQILRCFVFVLRLVLSRVTNPVTEETEERLSFFCKSSSIWASFEFGHYAHVTIPTDCQPSPFHMCLLHDGRAWLNKRRLKRSHFYISKRCTIYTYVRFLPPCFDVRERKLQLEKPYRCYKVFTCTVNLWLCLPVNSDLDPAHAETTAQKKQLQLFFLNVEKS
jgi:hypothetical protein